MGVTHQQSDRRGFWQLFLFFFYCWWLLGDEWKWRERNGGSIRWACLGTWRFFALGLSARLIPIGWRRGLPQCCQHCRVVSTRQRSNNHRKLPVSTNDFYRMRTQDLCSNPLSFTVYFYIYLIINIYFYAIHYVATTLTLHWNINLVYRKFWSGSGKHHNSGRS